jgi:hypothetical protein
MEEKKSVEEAKKKRRKRIDEKVGVCSQKRSLTVWLAGTSEGEFLWRGYDFSM